MKFLQPSLYFFLIGFVIFYFLLDLGMDGILNYNELKEFSPLPLGTLVMSVIFVIVPILFFIWFLFHIIHMIKKKPLIEANDEFVLLRSVSTSEVPSLNSIKFYYNEIEKLTISKYKDQESLYIQVSSLDEVLCLDNSQFINKPDLVNLMKKLSLKANISSEEYFTETAKEYLEVGTKIRNQN